MSENVDYMEQIISCAFCGIHVTRRDYLQIHVSHPCPELLASQERGEELLRRMEDEPHNSRILTFAVGRYAPYCDHCGWRGPIRAKWETARDDAIAHDYKANRTDDRG